MKRVKVTKVVFTALFLVSAGYIGYTLGDNGDRLKSLNQHEVESYFTEYAREHGTETAFLELQTAELADLIDIHSVGHKIGDVLYDREGVTGMVYCDDSFRYACAHSIVIGHLTSHGANDLMEFIKICEGVVGIGGYDMCFHGLGHGVLAYTSYDYQSAIELCGTLAYREFNNREAEECVGGVVMELYDGFHDVELWKKNTSTLFESTEPIDLCSEEYIPELYSAMCFTYITLFLYADVNAPYPYTPESTMAASSECEVINNPRFRDMCYGGFPKEIAGSVIGRDIRMIEGSTDIQLQLMHLHCQAMTTNEGKDSCEESMVLQLYRGGYYEPILGARYCHQTNEEYTEDCHETLFHAVQTNPPINQGAYQRYCTFIDNVGVSLCPES